MHLCDLPIYLDSWVLEFHFFDIFLNYLAVDRILTHCCLCSRDYYLGVLVELSVHSENRKQGFDDFFANVFYYNSTAVFQTELELSYEITGVLVENDYFFFN